jgi:hypothetical protein
MDVRAQSIFQSLLNLGFSDVNPDSGSLGKLERNEFDDAFQPFAQVTTPLQFAVVQKAIRAVGTKEVHTLSLEERQQIRGLMFASLNKSNALRWLSLAPSLLVVRYECGKGETLFSQLNELRSALHSSSVSELSIFGCGPSFRWRSFLDLPSLRTVRFGFNRSRVAGDSKVLQHLMTPYEEEGVVCQNYMVKHEWKRTNETDGFVLTGFFVHPDTVEDQPSLKPISLEDWTQKYIELVRATPSLTKAIVYHNPSWANRFLPHSSVQSLALGRLNAPPLADVHRCPSLTGLSVFEGYEHSSQLIRQLPLLTNLCRLDMEGTLNQEDWKRFVEVAPKLRLSTLNTLLDDSSDLGNLAPALPHLKSTLTELDLWSFVDPDAPELQVFAEALSQLKCLRTLSLPLGYLPSEVLPMFLPAVASTPVSDLTLFGMLNPESIEVVSSNLPSMRNLRWLSLCFDEVSEEIWNDGWVEPLTPDDWRALFNSLPPTLNTLELTRPFETSTGFGSSLELLSKTSLTVFSVRLGDGRCRSFFPDAFSEVGAVFPGGPLPFDDDDRDYEDEEDDVEEGDE